MAIQFHPRLIPEYSGQFQSERNGIDKYTSNSNPRAWLASSQMCPWTNCGMERGHVIVSREENPATNRPMYHSKIQTTGCPNSNCPLKAQNQQEAQSTFLSLGTQVEEYGMNPIGWFTVTCHLAKGRLGLRNLKAPWHFLRQPSSFWVRVLSARYLKWTMLWESQSKSADLLIWCLILKSNITSLITFNGLCGMDCTLMPSQNARCRA